jgi:FPC/CPF motif-containing protein YcgG
VHAEIVRTEQERESHLWALWHTARQITETRRAALNSGDVRAVPQNSHACFAFGGSGCEYLAICEGTASARDESRFTKLKTVHPELECTAENTTEENH